MAKQDNLPTVAQLCVNSVCVVPLPYGATYVVQHDTSA